MKCQALLTSVCASLALFTAVTQPLISRVVVQFLRVHDKGPSLRVREKGLIGVGEGGGALIEWGLRRGSGHSCPCKTLDGQRARACSCATALC